MGASITGSPGPVPAMRWLKTDTRQPSSHTFGRLDPATQRNIQRNRVRELLSPRLYCLLLGGEEVALGVECFEIACECDSSVAISPGPHCATISLRFSVFVGSRNC